MEVEDALHSRNQQLGEPALATEVTPLILLSKSNAAGAGLAPLFRDPTGAIPGLQAYSDALDKNPIAVKALTSLVGWLLGDLIAQVSLSSLSSSCPWSYSSNPSPLPISLGLHFRRLH
jgi:hypothetical protein